MIARLALSLLIGATPAFASRHVFDVSGAPGVADPDGRPDFGAGHGYPSHRPDGHDGGHAREIVENGRLRKKGWDAGSLKLNLSVDARSTVKIEGHRIEPESSREKRVLDRVPLSNSTSLHFLAGGGKGGHGGAGGRGQDGARGVDGIDATRYSWGSSGSRGGHGGNEGHSTDGGDAGRGGHVTIQFPIEDTDLAMLVDHVDVSGATGGVRGTSRGVGRGGPGGRGGSSYFYFIVATDSDDNVIVIPMVNPGGFNGRKGKDGKASAVRTRHGRDSQPGRYVFEVKDERGLVTPYPGRYELRLMPGYHLTGSHNRNGFFEPGETITISNLTVRNVGASPTPKYQRVHLFVSDSQEWIRSDERELTLPKVLDPGEEYTFTGQTIGFHLAEKTRSVAGRLRDVEILAPRARVSRVEREFTAFSEGAQTPFKVQYPIEITPLQSLITIAPGEAQRVLFKITNISNQTIGRAAETPWLRQAYATFRRTAGSTSSSDFVIADRAGGGPASPEDGIQRAIEGLRPGESKIVETIVGFRRDAAHYSQVGIQPELFLESILEKDKINLIQYEPYELRVSKAFRHTPDADVLLVANHGLDAKALDALEATSLLKQVKMDIWDFSRYGFFDFSHRIEDYGRLFEAYRGKTIVVLGNVTRTPVGEARTHDLLDPDQIIEAARRYGVKIVLIDSSDDPVKSVERLTEPRPLKFAEGEFDENLRDFKSTRHFVKELASAVHEVQEALGDTTSFLGVSRMRVTQTPILPWSTPKATTLRKRAMRLIKATDRLTPESRVFIDYDFEPTVKSTFLGLWKTWDLGSLSVRRSVDESKTSVVAIKLPHHQIDDPKFIMSDEFQTAFDFALNFNTKLGLLDAILHGKYDPRHGEVRLPRRLSHLKARSPHAYAQALVHSLMIDLLHEQITIRPGPFGSRVKEKDLWYKLDLLKKFTHHDYTQFKLDANTAEGMIFVDLVTSLRFFNARITTVWDRWFSFGLSRNMQASRTTEQMIERLVNTVFADVPAAKALIQEQIEKLEKRAGEAKVGRADLVEFLDVKGLAKMAIRDAEVHVAADSRVRGADRQQEIARAEEARRRAAFRVRRGVERQTAKLRLSLAECEALLAPLSALEKVARKWF